MNLDNILGLWPILLFVASTIWTQLTARGKVNAKQIAAIEREHTDEINALRSRVDVLEASKPTHDDLDSIHRRVTDVAKGQAEIKGELKGQSRLLENILKALLERE